jgi:hypothetical protein
MSVRALSTQREPLVLVLKPPTTWARWRAFTQLLLAARKIDPHEMVFRLAEAWLKQAKKEGHQAGCQCHPCATARILQREFRC